MKLYLSVIGIAMAAVSLINIALGTAAPHYVIIAVVWCTALQFAFDGIIAILINKMVLNIAVWYCFGDVRVI